MFFNFREEFMHKFIIKLSELNNELLNDDKIECFIIPTELITADFKSSKIILVMGENAIEVCKQNNLDGVVVDMSKEDHIKPKLKAIKNELGGKVLGVITRNRRHEAMIVSEEEPDFVIFRAWKDGIEKVMELVEWYNEMFLIQSAVMVEDDGIDYKDFKTDIVILSK